MRFSIKDLVIYTEEILNGKIFCIVFCFLIIIIIIIIIMIMIIITIIIIINSYFESIQSKIFLSHKRKKLYLTDVFFYHINT